MQTRDDENWRLFADLPSATWFSDVRQLPLEILVLIGDFFQDSPFSSSCTTHAQHTLRRKGGLFKNSRRRFVTRRQSPWQCRARINGDLLEWILFAKGCSHCFSEFSVLATMAGRCEGFGPVDSGIEPAAACLSFIITFGPAPAPQPVDVCGTSKLADSPAALNKPNLFAGTNGTFLDDSGWSAEARYI